MLTSRCVVARKQASTAAARVPNPAQHQCAHCGREANLNCKACQGAPKSADLKAKMSVWYCGKNCQKNEWANHKPICKQAQARLEICRIGGLLQSLFYTFARVTNIWSLGRIDKSGGVWILRPPSEYPWTSIIVPFPPPCVTSVEEENAILSYGSCSLALSCLHNVITRFLKGELGFANCSRSLAN